MTAIEPETTTYEGKAYPTEQIKRFAAKELAELDTCLAMLKSALLSGGQLAGVGSAKDLFERCRRAAESHVDYAQALADSYNAANSGRSL